MGVDIHAPIAHFECGYWIAVEKRFERAGIGPDVGNRIQLGWNS